MFTLDGVPLIYNGMEAGDTTESRAPALFESLKVMWPMASERPEFGKFYAALIPLRKQHPALQSGQMEWVHNSDEQHVVTYLRRSGEETFLIEVNLSNTPVKGTTEGSAGEWKELELPTHQVGAAGAPAMALGAFECRIFEKQGE